MAETPFFTTQQKDTDIDNTKVSITMSFEPVRLPPFQDVLIIAKKGPHGLYGMSKCMDLLVPDGFDLCEIQDDTIEAVIISRRIQKRIQKEKILEMLKIYIFPEISDGDLIKVDIDVRKIIHLHRNDL